MCCLDVGAALGNPEKRLGKTRNGYAPASQGGLIEIAALIGQSQAMAHRGYVSDNSLIDSSKGTHRQHPPGRSPSHFQLGEKMRYRMAIEDIEPKHWVAWIVDLPGCYSSAQTMAEAIAQAPTCIARYFAWIAGHDNSLPIPPEPIEVEVVETFQSFPSTQDLQYIVNAFFAEDKRPLGYWDVVIASRLLDWSHEALFQVVQSIDERRLNQPIAGEVRGSIAGILAHIASAENWYLGMLDLALDRTLLPERPLDRIARVRRNTKAQLWKLVGETRITENNDELWSARKIIRRTLWHTRDHTQHIARLSTYFVLRKP